MRMYSSGMAVRLAFSMFACLRPEIFVVDEALSVGDVHFQQKCVQRIEEMRAAGTTFLFVSHDMGSIRRICTEAILLNHGQTVFAGAPEEAVSRYYAVCGEPDENHKPEEVAPIAHSAPSDEHASLLEQSILNTSRSRHGTGEVQIVAATLQNEHGRHSLMFPVFSTMTIRMLLRSNRAVQEPNVGIHIYDRLGNLVFASSTRQLRVTVPALAAGEQRSVTFRIGLPLQPGAYTFSLGCSEPHGGESPDVGVLHDRHEGLGPFEVGAPEKRQSEGVPFPFYGLVQLPMEVTQC